MSLEKREGLEAVLGIICFILREMRGPWRVSTRGVTWFAFCKEYSSCEMNTDKGELYVGGFKEQTALVRGLQGKWFSQGRATFPV